MQAQILKTGVLCDVTNTETGKYLEKSVRVSTSWCSRMLTTQKTDHGQEKGNERSLQITLMKKKNAHLSIYSNHHAMAGL